jgi:hypothetical protein
LREGRLEKRVSPLFFLYGYYNNSKRPFTPFLDCYLMRQPREEKEKSMPQTFLQLFNRGLKGDSLYPLSFLPRIF